MTRILFPGLGWEQSDFAARLKKAGHRVFASSPAVPEVMAAVRLRKANAVVSDQCDYSRFSEETASRLSGLKTRARGTAAGVSKLLQRSLAPASVPQPKWAVCHDLDSARRAFRRFGGDVMVKPSDSRGSIGVRRVRAIGELEQAYYGARAGGQLGPVLVERFVKGELVTLDGLLRGGRFSLEAISLSTHSTSGGVRLYQHVYYRPEDQKTIAKKTAPLVAALCRAYGMTDGFVHSEWLWDKGPVFVELANRAPGIRAVATMIEPLCGRDLYAEAYPELLPRRAVPRRRYFVQQFHFGPIRNAGRPFLTAAAKNDPRLVDHLIWPHKKEDSSRVVRLGHATFGGDDLPALRRLAARCGARSAR